VKFEGIHAGEGLEVVNLSSQPREVECILGDNAGRWPLSLQPGHNRCVLDSPSNAGAHPPRGA